MNIWCGLHNCPIEYTHQHTREVVEVIRASEKETLNRKAENTINLVLVFYMLGCTATTFLLRGNTTLWLITFIISMIAGCYCSRAIRNLAER